MSDDTVQPVGNNAQAQVLAYVERIERLKEEAAGIAEDIKTVFGEAKSSGFDVGVIRKVLSIRAGGVGAWRESIDLIETYLQATGDLS